MGLWVHRNRPLHVVCTVTESFSELRTQQLRKILKPLFSVIESRKALNPWVTVYPPIPWAIIIAAIKTTPTFRRYDTRSYCCRGVREDA